MLKPSPATVFARSRSLMRLAPFLVFFVVAIAVVGWHMVKHPQLSPIDENAHFDYLRVLPDVPEGSDRLSQTALRETACRGYPPDLFDRGLVEWDWPPCKSESFDPNAFPGGGHSTAGSTAPFYYAVTAAATRPIATFTDLSPLTLARAFGAMWLAGLMSVSYLLARRINSSRLAAGAAAVFLGTSSDVVTSVSTVGPDTATALTGGLVILAALTYDGSRRTALWLLLATLVASVTKLTAFTAVGAAMIILVCRAMLGRADPLSRHRVLSVGMSALVGTLFAATSAAWFYRPTTAGSEADAAAAAGPVPERTPVSQIVPWADIKSSLFFNFLPPNVGNYNASFLEDLENANLERLMAGVMVMSLLATAMVLRRNTRASAIGWGVLTMAVVGPAMLIWLNAYAYGMYFALPARYGYGLLTAFAAVTAWTLRGAGPARALAIVAAASFANVFV